MIWKLREYLAEINLKIIIRNWQAGSFFNIETAKKGLVLISFSDLNVVNIQEIHKLIKQVSPLIDLKFLSYIKNTKALDNVDLPEEWIVITKKDLNFNLVPKDISAFSSDVIFDFTTKFQFPLLFTLLNSNANTRMGARREWNVDFLDFMIKTDESKGFNYTARHLVHYLNKIYRNNAA